jgi:hypothetical protein
MIAAAALLPGLKERAGTLDGELLTFTDADALAAFRTIVERRPHVVTLERMFAVTPRGAALINRIKADPTLRDAEIRVMAHDSDHTRVVPRAAPVAAPALDHRGTRRAPRYTMAENTVVVVDGKSGKLIDLSTIGAQTMLPCRAQAEPADCGDSRRRDVEHEIHRLCGVDRVRDVVVWRASLSARESRSKTPTLWPSRRSF